MIIKKTTDLYFQHNDIYILEHCNSKIIINNNNQGIILLDNSLHFQKNLVIPQEPPIYSIYKKYNDKALLLYLPDACKLIFVDLETNNHYTISLLKSFDTEVLSPNYYWFNDILILTSFNDNFYQLDFTTKTLYPISNDIVKTNAPSFFNFWNVCKQYNILKLYPDQQCFIFQRNDHSIGFFNHQKNNQQIITELSDGWYDVEYKNNIFLFIHEKKIDITNNQNRTILNPLTGYIFLKVRFLNNNQIVILSSKSANPRECLLETYFLSQTDNNNHS